MPRLFKVKYDRHSNVEKTKRYFITLPYESNDAIQVTENQIRDLYEKIRTALHMDSCTHCADALLKESKDPICETCHGEGHCESSDECRDTGKCWENGQEYLEESRGDP